MKLLQDRVAVISGAATQKGIGLATAQLFAEHGAAVALLDLERQEPQRVAAAIGDAHRGYVCDVTKKDQCEGVAQQIIQDFGAVDILINNAGITQPIRIMGDSTSKLRRGLGCQLEGYVICLSGFYSAHDQPRARLHRFDILSFSTHGRRFFWRAALLCGQSRHAWSDQGHGSRACAQGHSG